MADGAHDALEARLRSDRAQPATRAETLFLRYREAARARVHAETMFREMTVTQRNAPAFATSVNNPQARERQEALLRREFEEARTHEPPIPELES